MLRKLGVFILFLLAPALIVFLVAREAPAKAEAMAVSYGEVREELQLLKRDTEEMGSAVFSLVYTVERQQELFMQQDERLTELVNLSSEQKQLSDDIYEQKILHMLGPAHYAHLSDRTEIKIFSLNELGYRGYIAKVKLFDPKAFRVALAHDTLGKLETTSSAAKRYDAVLAINGGGFYSEIRNGTSYAQLIGNTVIDGSLVEPFNGYPGDLFFVGVNKKGQVVGNTPRRHEDIMNLNPAHGVSFTPILLQNGQKMIVPEKWKTTRQPRTIIGKYANDDLIMIVVDGRQGDWSVGVTLERLQDKLLELGVKDAYNLDGGGSSAMYYNGKLLNRPSDGRERPVVNNILVMP